MAPQQPPTPHRTYTTAQAAALLGVSNRHVQNLFKDPRYPLVHGIQDPMNNRLYIDADDFDQHLVAARSIQHAKQELAHKAPDTKQLAAMAADDGVDTGDLHRALLRHEADERQRNLMAVIRETSNEEISQLRKENHELRIEYADHLDRLAEILELQAKHHREHAERLRQRRI